MTSLRNCWCSNELHLTFLPENIICVLLQYTLCLHVHNAVFAIILVNKIRQKVLQFFFLLLKIIFLKHIMKVWPKLHMKYYLYLLAIAGENKDRIFYISLFINNNAHQFVFPWRRKAKLFFIPQTFIQPSSFILKDYSAFISITDNARVSDPHLSDGLHPSPMNT